MMTRAILTLAIVLSIAGCADGTAEVADSTSSTNGVVAPAESETTPPDLPSSTTTTISIAPTTTTVVAWWDTTTTTFPLDDLYEVPYPDNRSDDWLLVMTELNDYIQWADEIGDPALLAVAFEPGSHSYDRMHCRYSSWAEEGIRDAPGDTTDTVSVDVVAELHHVGMMTIDVVDSSTARTRIDRDGDVVEEIPRLPLARSRITLRWDDAAGWRIAYSQVVELLEDVAHNDGLDRGC